MSFLLKVSYAVLCLVVCNCSYFNLPLFNCTTNIITHYDLGFCIGVKTKSQIISRWSQDNTFQAIYDWIQTSNGSIIYEQFVTSNRNKWPLYFDEIEGMADGANVSIQYIVIATMVDELQYFFDKSESEIVSHPINIACTDYLLQLYSVNNTITSSYMAHNEDNGIPNRNNTFLVQVKITGEEEFFCYGYASELLSQAVCWNTHFIFSSNYVSPTKAILGGFGRNFITRQMIDEISMNNAMLASAMDGQCQGHNYQIAEWMNGNSTDSEAAYEGLHVFTVVNEDNDGWLFHTNLYIHLNISQMSDVSSEARDNTAKGLGKPRDINDMLDFLGNTDNQSFPIYKNGQNGGYTLHTFSVDVITGDINIYADNPLERKLVIQCRNNGNYYSGEAYCEYYS